MYYYNIVYIVVCFIHNTKEITTFGTFEALDKKHQK